MNAFGPPANTYASDQALPWNTVVSRQFVPRKGVMRVTWRDSRDRSTHTVTYVNGVRVAR